jgi:hypothetical protein
MRYLRRICANFHGPIILQKKLIVSVGVNYKAARHECSFLLNEIKNSPRKQLKQKILVLKFNRNTLKRS